jgi:PE family
MSLVITAPDTLTAAATDIADIESWLDAAHRSAATPTAGLVAAADDEVSTAVASLFSSHAQQYQALSAQAAAFHTRFAQALHAGAGKYAAAEAAGRSSLQFAERDALAAVNAPTDALVGRPLIGNGADGTTNAQGVGTPGGAGGILLGSGGKGGDSTAIGVAGGAGGSAGLLGTGGTGGMGGFDAPGGAGGIGGRIWGNGGIGGVGGPGSVGGTGGSARWFGHGGAGGLGGELGGTGGVGGRGGLIIGSGGAGGQGGVSGGPGGVGPGAGGAGGAAVLLGAHGATGATGTAPTIGVDVNQQQNRPYVNVSIGGGPTSQVVLDTGSEGLIVPPQDVNLTSLGNPIGSGTVNFGDSTETTTETFNIYRTTVNFGNGIVTTPYTEVGVVTSASQTITATGQTTNYPATSAMAVMGVGANPLGGANPSVGPVQMLPGTLSQGILIDEPGGYVQFGANPLPVGTVNGVPQIVSGAPVTTLYVQVGNSPTLHAVTSIIDSGGLQGLMPASLGTGSVNGYVPAGTHLTFYNSSGVGLYQQTVGSAPAAPSVGTSDLNTGNTPFEVAPIYLLYSPSGTGTFYFDAP